ncbi:MAG TPA: DUF1003 domain-containing protein [Capsulimonadaceae bacterium]|jgi:uncharacterized membrane protein
MPHSSPTQPEPAVHPVSASLEAILTMHNLSEKSVSKAQRRVERLTEIIARPVSLLVVAGFVLVWLIGNYTIETMHGGEYDAPPFFWLQGCIGLLALLMDAIILITQHRQGQRAEHRAQLDLQLSIAAEQRLAKMISLMEELRRDLPNVQNRYDPIAEAMTNPVDTAKASSDLDQALRETDGREFET